QVADHDGENRLLPAIRAEWCDRDMRREQRAVVAAHPCLDLHPAMTRHVIEQRDELLRLVREQYRYVDTIHALRRVSGQALCPGVPACDLSIRIHDQHGVVPYDVG